MSVGNLNGIWEKLLKFVLGLTSVAVVPTLCWGAWVTVGVISFNAFMGSGERFSKDDGRTLETRVQTEQQAQDDRLTKTEINLQHLEKDLNEIKRGQEKIIEAVQEINRKVSGP